MKSWLEVAVLFFAVFLTGIDVNATASDESKITNASVWVKQWTESTKNMLEKGYKCDETTQKGMYGQVFLIIPKISMAQEFASSDDRASFEEAIRFSKDIAQKEIKQCKDISQKWVYFIRISDALLAYIKK